MCARFTVLSDTPIAAAIAGWAIPLSRNNTIWMRWRCAAGIFQRSAVLSRRTSALLHLAICFPRIRCRKRITDREKETISSFHRLASKNTDSSRYGGSIRYRDFITVALVVDKPSAFSDNWIYIHDPAVKVGRVQNFSSWSPEMVPPGKSCLGMEYFCFEGDEMWNCSDEALIALAKSEIGRIGLIRPDDVVDACVVRQPKAYPVYDDSYRENVAMIRLDLEGTYPTLHLVGRNGMHKYNNQDHAMMTAILAARNILAGQRIYNLWDVNEDAEYHE